jgi:hypothetical protein
VKVTSIGGSKSLRVTSSPLRAAFKLKVTMKTSYLVILFLKILALSSGQNTRRSKSSLGNSIRRTNFNQHDLRTPSTQQREVFFVNLEDGFFGCQVNASVDILQLFEISKLCDGTPNCYLGSDESNPRLKCTSKFLLNYYYILYLVFITTFFFWPIYFF